MIHFLSFTLNIVKFLTWTFSCYAFLLSTIFTIISADSLKAVQKISHSTTLGVASGTQTASSLSSCCRVTLLPKLNTDQLKPCSCSYLDSMSQSSFSLFTISVFVLVTNINSVHLMVLTTAMGCWIWDYTTHYVRLSMINCIAPHLCLSGSPKCVCVCMYPGSNLGSWPLQTLCCSPPVSLEVWCSLSQCRASSGASAAAAEPAPAQVQDLAEDNTPR